MLYKAPPSEVLEWDDTSIVGMQRWLVKVLKLAQSSSTGSNTTIPALDAMTEVERDVYRTTHQTIKQVTEAMSSTFSFNTAISDLIKLSNTISGSTLATNSPIYHHAVQSLVTMMSPMAPAMAEESWESLSSLASSNSNSNSSVFQQAWPTWEEAALVKDTVDCVIQVNGKTRLTVSVPAGLVTDANHVEQLTRATTQGQKWLGDQTVRKTIVAKNGALVNFIV